MSFSNWVSWSKKASLAGIEYPGVYCIAISDSSLDGVEFSWFKDIAYIGMTNSIKGLAGRLRQFERTLHGSSGHGGADRVRYVHSDFEVLAPRLYVSVQPIHCNSKDPKAIDYRAMGRVAQLEYDCFASYFEAYGRLPPFNDQKNAPKASKHGR